MSLHGAASAVAVDADLSLMCDAANGWPAVVLEGWRALHAVAQTADSVASQQEDARASLCSYLWFLANAVSGALPLLGGACPALAAGYFQRAAEFSLAAGHVFRAHVLLQLGAPFHVMAHSRARQAGVRSRALKEGLHVADRYRAALQSLCHLGPAAKPWRFRQAAQRKESSGGRIAIHSMCDTRGPSLKEMDIALVEQNHRSYADRWGYQYRMHHAAPGGDREPHYRYGQTRIAFRELSSPDPPSYFVWFDCDVLVANLSVSIEAVLRTYELDTFETDWVVAEDASGINSGVFILRGGSSRALSFLRGALESPWTVWWEQSQWLHSMAEISDLFARRACADGATAADANFHDFKWAGNLRTVPQQALNSYTPEVAREWGAEAWRAGDFILHFAGCPLRREACMRNFTEAAAWIQANGQ